MLILTLRTDKPEAELGLYDDLHSLTSLSWHAHRELAETIHLKIQDMLTEQDHTLNEVEGIVVYAGPGSFTGLRIGFSVANTMAYSLHVPITTENGEDWIVQGIKRLQAGKGKKVVLPDYGSDPKTTQQRK